MNAFRWLIRRHDVREASLSLYTRGMVKAKAHDQRGAINDYTAAIDMCDAPNDVRAMALFNRALVHVATGDARKGVDDLKAVLTMDEAPNRVKKKARQKLARMEFQSSRSGG